MAQARILTDGPEYVAAECSLCPARWYEGDIWAKGHNHVLQSGHEVVFDLKTVMRPADQESADRLAAARGIHVAQRLSEAVQAADRSREHRKDRRRKRLPTRGPIVYESMDELVWSRKKR